MILSSVGTDMRHSLVLILHESAEPWTMPMHDGEWKPSGLCPKQ